MNDRQLESLIRRVVELDQFGEPLHAGRQGARPRPIAEAQARRAQPARWLVPLAAAVFALFALRPVEVETEKGRSFAEFVTIDHIPRVSHDARSRIDAFRPCADQDAAALVLFRVWDDACDCIEWKLHQFADGSAVTRLTAGEALDIRMDVTDAPALDQYFILAVARQRDGLPHSRRATQQLLTCLNSTCPPVFPGEDPLPGAETVIECFPTGVELLQRRFGVD